MGNDLTQVRDTELSVIEEVLYQGDLSGLTSIQRVDYVNKVCETVGLNPLTKPFDYIKLNGKLVLYAKKDCTDQLRAINGISIKITEEGAIPGARYRVRAQAADRHGRVDEDLGVVSINGLTGEGLSNAIMKATTKAKRRVTLSISGLGFLDDSEIQVADAQPLRTNPLDRLEPPDRAIADFNRPLEGATEPSEGEKTQDTSMPEDIDPPGEQAGAEPSASQTADIDPETGEILPAAENWHVLNAAGEIYKEGGNQHDFVASYRATVTTILEGTKSEPRRKMTQLKKLAEANDTNLGRLPLDLITELETGRMAHNKRLGALQKELDNQNPLGA